MNKKPATPDASPSTALPTGYGAWLADIKTRVQAARSRAALAANAELVTLYWQIGNDILLRQAEQGWGAKVIDRLASDLREAFPEMKGFSRANLLYMRAFAQAWPDAVLVQQLAGQLPWFHNVVLLTRLKDGVAREWYARKAVAEGWSRVSLELHIRKQLRDRQLKAPEDKPTIGLLLCKTKDHLVAEYALSGIDKPIGVAEYQLVRALPATLAPSLPTVEQLENELASEPQTTGATRSQSSTAAKAKQGKRNKEENR